MKKILLTAFLFSLPIIVSAAGLIPCGGPAEEPCQACHFVILVENVADWLIRIFGIIIVIAIIVAGVRLASSTGNADTKGQSKRIIASLIIGYIILLGAWFVIDFGLRLFVNGTMYGTWNADVVQCVAQPTVQESARPSANPANNLALSTEAINNRVAAIRSAGGLQNDIEAAAQAAGITNQYEINTLRALISQESSNCQNKVGPPTNFGRAYGCGQMLVSTARGLDPELAGLSDAEVAARLRDDDSYNLGLSAKYFGELLEQYDGNRNLALAAYNGGGKANQPSVDCPGLLRWQCVWNEPGCYNTGRTDCARNEGFSSYEQTRNYVANINAIAQRL